MLCPGELKQNKTKLLPSEELESNKKNKYKQTKQNQMPRKVHKITEGKFITQIKYAEARVIF